MSINNIGNKQIRIICGMPYLDRLKFLAEGLPIIHKSAMSYLEASEEIAKFTRERRVLRTYAEEESAKALILMDIVRCPPKIIASKIGKMTGWFYNHLARLIYAEASDWKPMNISQLQEYIESNVKSHYLEGDYGEYIVQNWSMFNRESTLYADIFVDEHGTASWSEPQSFSTTYSTPSAVRVIDALAALGIFSASGLNIVTKIWGDTEFINQQNHKDSQNLIERTINSLISANLQQEHATDEHVNTLFQEWQLPMYSTTIKMKNVSMDDLLEERNLQPF